ncbi:MAG: GIY-YIG nuclease family protein [Candidatus Levybacteria bacterium]|nr:GIY-YIG nuclease family protein [Candidatus Levybacteria bacterium]
MYFTYVLRCFDSKSGKVIFYVGITDDIIQRVKDHRSGSTRTTRSFDKIELVYYEACLNKKDARIREGQLKTGFGRGYLKRRIANFIKESQD